MTDISLPAEPFAEGAFRIGQVFSRAWSVFSGNFVTFVLVTGIAGLPSLLIQYAAPDTLGSTYADVAMALIAAIVMLGFWILSQAIVLYGAFQVMRGHPIDLAAAARIGSRRVFSVLGLAIVLPVLCFLAAALFVVPGVILYLVWFVATPACVVERLGPFSAMERSARLSSGHRWKIFGLLLLVALPLAIAGVVFDEVAEAVGFGSVMTAFCGVMGEAIWNAVLAAVTIATYHDLRVAKEGVDTAELGAVFE